MIKNYILAFLALPIFVNAQSVEFESAIIADLSSYSGATNFSGLGEYEIFLDTETGVLDKPVILLDGVDPFNTRSTTGIYGLLDYTGTGGDQNLGDLLRAEGFDMVSLNFPRYLRLSDGSLLNIDDVADTNADMIIDEADFPEGSTLIDGGSDFIERNAMLLVDLINTLNTDKIGDEELVIIGPSSGGLISRYALNYMENQSLNHNTRLYISFDAPHLGGNVPLGLQHQFNFLAFGLGDGLNILPLQPIVENLLKSPAARQVLTDHLEGHLLSGSNIEFDPTKLLPEAHPYRAIFDSAINGLTSTGFPETTRNVAIINGSGIGAAYKDTNGNDISPGFNMIDAVFDVPDAPFTTAQSVINMTPTTDLGTTLLNKILIETNFSNVTTTIIDVEVFAQAPDFTDGIDAAPGGLYDITDFTESIVTGGIFEEFTNNLKLEAYSIVPSVSAMALEFTNNETNWYAAIDQPADGTTNETTPFTNWYMPDVNEPHMFLSEENATFAFDEIVQTSLASNGFETLYAIKIAQNPVRETLTLLSDTIFNNVSIEINDVTGKSVFRKENVSLSSRNEFPLNLQSALYLLSVRNINGLDYREKIIVR